jgi:biotin operon repressor
MRTEEALKYLRESGAKGVSTEEFSKKFGFKYQNSVSKVIRQLRGMGHAIEYNKDTGVYVLIEEANLTDETTKGSVPVDGEIYEENPEGDTEGDTEDAKDESFAFRISCKRDKVLEFMTRAGKDGASLADLSKYSGIKSGGIAYHIHALRKMGHNITNKNGRYFVRANNKNPKYNTGTKNLPISDIPVDVLALLGDKRLINNIPKLRKEELPTYMDFLKKIIFYTKCALAMHETRDMLDTITIGDES